MSDLTPGFIVAHSHRLEELTDLVVRLTGTYPLPPLVNETLLVQSNGISQWLKIHLAEAAGIAAMLDVTLPARFQWQAYRAVLGDELPTTSPFDKDRLTWRILRLLPDLLHQQPDSFQGLVQYLGDSDDPRKWYQLSERLADLFDQYQMYRADWLADWASGGTQQADAENRWQPILWRELLQDVGAQQWNNRAQLHQQFIQAARQLTPASRPKALPPRVIVFGISSLPQQLLELLDALKGCMQIVLCVHNPCRYHWADIIDGHELMRLEQRRHAFKPGMQADMHEDALHALSNPLLAAWGKQGRDYIRLLDQFDETRQKSESLRELSFELFDGAPPTSVLQEIQHDILELRSAEERLQLGSDSDLTSEQSLHFHSAHSPQREVEILHDQLLAAFAQNPDLRPRDIMVMVPDIDRYAPHINAVFGKLDRNDPRYIPYTLADQGQRHQQPLLIALEYLVTIRHQRLTASALLDILQVPAVQKRFQLQPEWLPQLQRWIDGASIRWALHAEHREALGVPADEGRNSWLFGLQRMLLGYAVGTSTTIHSEPSLWSQTEPYVEVAGLEAQAAGALAELLHTVEDYFTQSEAARSAAEWQALLSNFVDALFAPESDFDIALVSRIHEQLAAWSEATMAAEYSAPIDLTVVIESWLSRLDQASLQQRFLAGSVNFATLMPMRAIPFQWVCLLGMNDGDYPRSQKPFDFDLMARDYRPGDRSRRDDDRYLFLEALLSAREKLYISWCGRSIRDNSERPPSVLVSQLLEYVQQCWPQIKSEQLIQQHGLQPFSWQYFERSEPASRVPFTYAHEWRLVHDVQQQLAQTQPLSDWFYDSAFSARHLATALEQPAKLLFNLRFEVYFGDRDATVKDEERFALDGLSTYQLHEPLLDALVDSLYEDVQVPWEVSLNHQIQRYVRAGILPAGAAGATMSTHFQELLAPNAEILLQWLAAYPDSLPMQHLHAECSINQQHVSVESIARRIRVNDSGQRLSILVKASKLVDSKGQGRPHYALVAWVEHVLLNQEAPTTTVLLGQVGTLELKPLDANVARNYLQRLLRHTHQALQQPIGLDFETIFEGWSASYKQIGELIQQQQPEVNHQKAAKFYEESGQFFSARVERAVYSGRLFPTYSQLIKDEAILNTAPQLYLPMLSALFSASTVEEQS
ncbi:exodeoxyribonuclease V subunit gamma [Pseudidiomarina aestuarii]|nr:exodeoxyribonuclease V subunit gamma [Pseudidiomarina aestuarii]